MQTDEQSAATGFNAYPAGGQHQQPHTTGSVPASSVYTPIQGQQQSQGQQQRQSHHVCIASPVDISRRNPAASYSSLYCCCYLLPRNGRYLFRHVHASALFTGCECNQLI
jgi:hypothetical protein